MTSASTQTRVLPSLSVASKSSGVCPRCVDAPPVEGHTRALPAGGHSRAFPVEDIPPVGVCLFPTGEYKWELLAIGCPLAVDTLVDCTLSVDVCALVGSAPIVLRVGPQMESDYASVLLRSRCVRDSLSLGMLI